MDEASCLQVVEQKSKAATFYMKFLQSVTNARMFIFVISVDTKEA